VFKLGLISIAMLILAACGNASASNDSGLNNEVSIKVDPLTEIDSKARSLVLEKLRDPNSAQFRNVQRVPFVDDPKDLKPGVKMPYVYCGEVNSKNAYGGYVGYTKFGVSGDVVAISDPEFPDNLIHEVFCKRERLLRFGKSVDFSRGSQ